MKVRSCAAVQCQLVDFRHSATSAVDLETDKNIQDIIRGPQFENVTMLTIA